ncbi:MAG: RHS repeat-associated core domain-containing protein [Bacteroidota bacterium]|nr:RHS repeat-associated core domain-containing protein [Bacteroidota bacterium]
MGCHKLKYYESETAIGKNWKIFVDGIEKTVSSQKICKDYYPYGMQMPGRTYSIAKTDGVPIIDHEFTSGNDISNWSNWGLTVSASGDDRLKAEGTGAWATAYASLSLEVGKRYRLTASIDLGSNLARVKYMVKNPSDGTFMFINNTKVDADIDVEFIATTTTADLIFQRADATSTNLLFYLDNVKVEEIGENYRFSFNGMEKDDEVKGNGNSLDFGARIYDPRLGRWLSLDTLQAKYPTISPYSFATNRPIIAIDIDGRDVYIVVTSMGGEGGARGQGHMALVVGNEEVGYYLVSLENPENLKTYVKEEEVIAMMDVNEIEALVAPNQAGLYAHKEDTWEGILDYISKNGPGIDNSEKNKGYGYDRILKLKGVTPEGDEKLIELLFSQEDGSFVYEFFTNNCSSFTIDMINEVFPTLINDKTKVDRPNNEFDNVKEDTDNWTVVKDDKKSNDNKRKENNKKNKRKRKEDQDNT